MLYHNNSLMDGESPVDIKCTSAAALTHHNARRTYTISNSIK